MQSGVDKVRRLCKVELGFRVISKGKRELGWNKQEVIS